MKILYNPIEDEVKENGKIINLGSDIKGWFYNHASYSHPRGKILQYQDDVGNALVATYPYLQDLTPEQAKDVLKKLESVLLTLILK